jgi:hypothetical protein
MKKILPLLLVCITVAAKPLNNQQPSRVRVAVRSGEWPISLESVDQLKGAQFILQFRDQQVLTGVVLDTLPFSDLSQLKYLEQALSVLKKGNNGDIARFNNYSIKRMDSRMEGRTYLLRHKWGLTNFKQPEADTLISTIRKL